MKIFDSIFHPPQVSFADVPTAVANHEQAINLLQSTDDETKISDSLKLYGLLKTLKFSKKCPNSKSRIYAYRHN